MNITKNHIGTGNYYWKQVASRMDAQYSHGGMTEYDFKAITVFPLLHITLTRIDIDTSTARLTYSIMVADQNIHYSNDFQGMTNAELFEEYGYTENANYAFVLQEIYIRLVKQMEYMEQALYNTLQIEKPYSLTPFAEDLDAVLTGYTGEITLIILNPIVTDGWC